MRAKDTGGGERRKRVFFVDPMSTGNPARYDYGVLCETDGDITYFCSKYIDTAKHSHIKYKHIYAYNRLRSAPLKAASYICSCVALLFIAVARRPDIVHVQWLKMEPFDRVVYGMIKALSGARIVFTAHNAYHTYGKTYFGTYGKVYNRLFDKIIVHTPRTRDEIMRRFNVPAERFAVIPHGIHKMGFDKELYDSQEAAYDAKYGLDGAFVVASLGTQLRYKGTDILAKVWSETPALRGDATLRLVIAGKVKEGLDLSPLDGIENATVVDARISDEEYYYLLLRTDVQVFPYRSNFASQSGALFIALSEHVPVLVADQGGLTDPLKHGHVGWQMGPCTEEALRRCLLDITRHRDAAREIKHDDAEWRKVTSAYDWHKISRRTQELYDSL